MNVGTVFQSCVHVESRGRAGLPSRRAACGMLPCGVHASKRVPGRQRSQRAGVPPAAVARTMPLVASAAAPKLSMREVRLCQTSLFK
jgi:hypothetical protein